MSNIWSERKYLNLTTYREVEEVLRRGRDFVIEGTIVDSAEFVHGTLVHVDGREHLDRRRALSRMISPNHPWGAKGTLFSDAFLKSVRRERSTATGTAVAFDLVTFVERVYWEALTQMIGLDGVDSPERLAHLQSLIRPAVQAFSLDYLPGDHEEALARSRAAMAELRSEYFLPSYHRRLRLVTDAGDEAAQRALPADQITSLLLADPENPDQELILRETIVLFSASVNNPVSHSAWALHDLEHWLKDHPEDRAKLSDGDYFNLVTKETVRLHRTGRPCLIRHCPNGAVLESTGREVPPGSWVAAWVRSANHDVTVFGADAAVFNPHREILDPAAKLFGVGFGSGPHMCLGRPLLVWDSNGPEVQGSLARVLMNIVEHGISTDPNGIQDLAEMEGSARFVRYDVTMPARDTTMR